MATTRKTRETPQTESVAVGLLPNGSAGAWEIAIDETTSGIDRWWMQIEGPSSAFYFEIPGLGIVDEMIDFLGSPAAISNHSRSLVITKDDANPIVLIKDYEFADRHFVAVGPVEKPFARFSLAAEDGTRILAALRQIEDDLAAD